MTIQMVKQFKTTQLQGETLGKRHYARVCELLSEVGQGEVVLLDFKGVDVVTGSWISAMIVPLYRRAADPDIDLFPVLCNASADWLDDLALLAKWTHQCYLVADKCTSPPRRATLVGSLDPGQRTTLDAVIELGEVTGAELERQKPNENVRATAWNNRLKDLYEKRLLRRSKRGREQLYSPVVEAIEING
ncbi:MAG: hypothetical protein HY000_38315 [Planctomycetes bacterium]|nr:hypothetical protein [Planctomycetota bacterium]